MIRYFKVEYKDIERLGLLDASILALIKGCKSQEWTFTYQYMQKILNVSRTTLWRHLYELIMKREIEFTRDFNLKISKSKKENNDLIAQFNAVYGKITGKEIKNK